MIENIVKNIIVPNTAFPDSCNRDNTLFFDIETTGFSPSSSALYLIGCAYYEDNSLTLRQWFCDTPGSELQIIKAFMEFIHNFSNIIHYNGSGFDIPYIIKKCQLYNIPCDMSGIRSIDIYKLIAPLKKIIKSENLKQKSIESFLGIDRQDEYDGGKLIKVYNTYLKNHDDELLRLLLLHNHDDVLGMTAITDMLNYTCIADGSYSFDSIELKDKTSVTGVCGKEAIITLTLDHALPKRVSCGNDSCYMTAYDNILKLCITAYTRELKYFYSNYRDYYYLPAEDRSIHKSVAFYVDKDFRTKAKAANCYSKKTGIFLPQYEEIISPYFKIDYYDKTTYFEYTDDFINNMEDVMRYCRSVIKKLL